MSDDFPGIDQPIWISRTEEAFPPRVLEIKDKTRGLWMRSRIDPREIKQMPWLLPTVAIVGSRAASGAGLEIARTMAWELTRAGILVLSGLARGIDSAAHEGALLAGGRTVAVLACGLDLCYPAEHKELAARICQNGLLLSEWRCGTQPLPWHFPRRNRLISALADIVVVVEAELRSGAFHTVRFALDQGREVMAVPRDPVIPGSKGPNRLIQEGAAPAIDASSVRAVLADLTNRRDPCFEVRPVEPGKIESPGQISVVGYDSTKANHPCGAGHSAGADHPATNSAGKSSVLCPSDQQSVAAGLKSPAGDILAVLVKYGSQTMEQIIERLPRESTKAILAEMMVLEIEAHVSRDKLGRYRIQRTY